MTSSELSEEERRRIVDDSDGGFDAEAVRRAVAEEFTRRRLSS